jgi:hypothetical protein
MLTVQIIFAIYDRGTLYYMVSVFYYSTNWRISLQWNFYYLGSPLACVVALDGSYFVCWSLDECFSEKMEDDNKISAV